MAKILLIGKTLPLFDRASGDHRLWMLSKILARMHDVDFIACQHTIREKETNKIFYPIWDSPVNTSRFDYLDDIYSDSLASAGIDVLNPNQTSTPTIRSHGIYDFRPLLQENYDLIIIEFYYLAHAILPWLREMQPQAKIYIDSVDIHWRRHEQEIFDAQKNGRPAMLKEEEVASERQKEILTYCQADGVIVVSDADSQELANVCSPVKQWRIPNIFVDSPLPDDDFQSRDSVVFVGNFDHHPNRAALDFLLEKVAPLVLERDPSIKFRIVGHNLDMDRPRLPANVELVGWVPNLTKEWQRARLSVAPVFISAGMNGKIGEALRAGVPTITTNLAAENMQLSAGENCLVANDGRGFTDRILALWQQENLWREMRLAGYEWVREKLGEKIWEDRLEKDIAALLPAARGRLSRTEIRPRQLLQPAPQTIAFPSTKKIKTSIVILAHNQWIYTRECLASLCSTLSSVTNFEVILIDNASSDETSRQARLIPGLRYIALNKNLGYAGGMNYGVSQAKGEHFILLNNDVVLSQGWFERLQAHAAAIPEIGIIGCLNNTEPGQQPSRLEQEYYSGPIEFEKFAQSLAITLHGRWHRCEKLSALLWWIPRDAWEKVGPLDTSFGRGYFEDDDYCLRMLDAGLRLVCAEDVYVHHFGSVSFGALAEGREPYLEAGMQKFIFKWGKRALEHIARTHHASLLRPVENYLGQSKGVFKPSVERISR